MSMCLYLEYVCVCMYPFIELVSRLPPRIQTQRDFPILPPKLPKTLDVDLSLSDPFVITGSTSTPLQTTSDSSPPSSPPSSPTVFERSHSFPKRALIPPIPAPHLQLFRRTSRSSKELHTLARSNKKQAKKGRVKNSWRRLKWVFSKMISSFATRQQNVIISNAPIWLLGKCYCEPKSQHTHKHTRNKSNRKNEEIELPALPKYADRPVPVNDTSKEDRKSHYQQHFPPLAMIAEQAYSSLAGFIASQQKQNRERKHSNTENTTHTHKRASSVSKAPSFLREFFHDMYSRIWITYRKAFPPIFGSNFTTDVGWGCMLRTSQMILAQALIVHFLTRGMCIRVYVSMYVFMYLCVCACRYFNALF